MYTVSTFVCIRNSIKIDYNKGKTTEKILDKIVKFPI